MPFFIQTVPDARELAVMGDISQILADAIVTDILLEQSALEVNMRMTQFRKELAEVRDYATQEIRDVNDGSKFSRGLASEGFMGGYQAALLDLELASRDIEPERWRVWRQLRNVES